MKQDDWNVWNEFIQTVTPLDKKHKAPLLKRLLTGRFFLMKRPPLSTRLDLHHFTLQEAFGAFQDFLTEHAARETRQIIVITGKGAQGKGVLRQEFPKWLERADIREKISRVETAPARMGGDGAFLVYLKRKKEHVSNGN